MLAVAVRAFEFELIVQQWQQIWIPTFSRHPSAVQQLPVDQRANALNNVDLALNKTNRNEFVQQLHVSLRFGPFTKLECKPFPIWCKVAAHQQHDSHHACSEFSQADCNSDGIATTRHPLDEVVFAVLPNPKAFFRQPAAQHFFRVLAKSRSPTAQLTAAIHPDFPVTKEI